ncbi:MAG: metallophosphoesterase [Nitrospirae bacterium]|nr:metallophosphoesterase [Nitrospirota bacterium]
MLLFFITFFTIYGGMHLYAFLKARAAFAFSLRASFSAALFMAIMVFAPVLIRLTERLEFELIARLLSYTGYLWMGVIFLFFSASLCIDIYRLLAPSSLALSAKTAFYLPLLISVSIAVYGYFEALNIRTEKVVIKTSKISKEIGRLRIVQISDVHIGLIIREKRLRKILEEVKKAKPDILVSTGDLVDGQINSFKGLAEPFREINPKYGMFAVTGNHEFYAGIRQALAFTEKAGFKILRGEAVTAAGVVSIAGVDDPEVKRSGLYRNVSEKELLSGLSRDKFTVLLKHRPVVDKDTISMFDLQLSGHTHKGQIFPFSLLTWYYYRHTIHAGHLRLMDNLYLYVSRGAGTWGPPIRFLSPPEITVIEIVHKDNK